MPEIKNTFLAGKMNKSLDDRLLPEGEYRDALNIQVTKSEGADVGVIQNIKGNVNLTNLNLPEGFEVIGSCFDDQNNIIYWFVTNNETSYIYRYGEDITPAATTTTTQEPPPSTTTTTLATTTTTTIPGQTTTTTIPITTTTTTEALFTTADIIGVDSPVVEDDVDIYSATISGNTSGDITYTWRVTKGEITGGTYDGSLRSVLTGTASTVPDIEVTWGVYETGNGLIELTAVRSGETGTDSNTVIVLQKYYIFNACDGGTTVIDQLSTPPTIDPVTGLGQQYIDLSQQPPVYYTWSGFTQNDSSGYPVVDLQPVSPTTYGCVIPTTTLAPEDITVTGPFTASASGESGVEYTIDTVYPTTGWQVTDAALQGFNPIDITLTTSTSGTGDGSITVTFAPYNGNGTETLRSQIIVTSDNVTPQVTGTIVISQGPA